MGFFRCFWQKIKIIIKNYKIAKTAFYISYSLDNFSNKANSINLVDLDTFLYKSHFF